ncbi:MAG TPA: peptide chain release factor 3 [Gemmatimonadales bacterium]|nr:peptide chain release factor 3 [Gemmatimonadales bacterium]
MAVEPDPTTLAREVARRRTFAIISHPDAGKTTLTEKLLLYGGAIHLAGTVKARRADRHVTSDWMELERQRGISVTSSVLQFEYADRQVNLLDTPGHQDFSEDTYRTLVAADSAVMLLDNRKGVEERTRQLFEVCKRRRMPIVTFVNKCDRSGVDAMSLLGDVERDLGIACWPATWPVYHADRFAGVADRTSGEVLLFDRRGDHGASRAQTQRFALDDPALASALGGAAVAHLADELHLLDEAGHPFDREAFLAGALSPVYFGSALSNFGVEPFLRDFLDLAPAPVDRDSSIGAVPADAPDFTGFVFKIQANMDPRHRDRVAFVRVCSGHFVAGMDVRQVRTGRTLRLAAPQQFMARERVSIEEAWPGDVIGIMDRGALRIGDTLSAAGDLEFQDIPRFPPEHFARAYPADPLRRKQLDAGLRELSEEGAAQVFYAEGETGPAPIVGAIGQLQFDVMLFRLEHEYGAPCRFEPVGYRYPRWVTGTPAAIEQAATARGRLRLYDTKGQPLLLFETDWALRWALENERELTFHTVAP